MQSLLEEKKTEARLLNAADKRAKNSLTTFREQTRGLVGTTLAGEIIVLKSRSCPRHTWNLNAGPLVRSTAQQPREDRNATCRGHLPNQITCICYNYRNKTYMKLKPSYTSNCIKPNKTLYVTC